MPIIHRPAVLLAALLLPSTAAAAGDPDAGAAKARVCQTCHGREGIAAAPQVPNLAGQDEWYLAEQLKAFRAGKRRNEQMDVVAKGLSDQDIADLAAWFAGFTVTVTGRR
ncbi:c-type cytochrome [Azospirillum sp. ST 5-10]|uniref:c-type cytochrome n=1 Tax=unclassified Azospirillum TaxID=2630922 RepID=UPI003F49EC7E